VKNLISNASVQDHDVVEKAHSKSK